MFIGLCATSFASFVYLICRSSSASCADHETQADFDVESYMGLWYEYSRSDNVPFEGGSCITAQYTLDSKRKVGVTNSQYLPDSDNIDSSDGKAYCSKLQPGQCGVKFNAFQPMGRYHVVSTDYTTYSIVYSC